MDPISAFFAAVLQSTSNVVHQQTSDFMGTEIQAVAVDYQGQRISFQHQLWRIREASVCADKKNNVGEFSKCTLAAKEFFVESCNYLQATGGYGWRFDKTKNMYCLASVSFSPTVAFVAPAHEETPIEIAKRECNKVILMPAASEEYRNRICAAYENLKKQAQQ